MKDFKYKSIFSSSFRCLIDKEKDLFLSSASLEKLKPFLPKIDTDKNFDLLPIVFNAFVAGRINKNGDVLSYEDSIKITESFVSKYIDVEHSRDKCIGVILNYGFSVFGSDKPLTLEEAKKAKEPFNVVLGGVIWRTVNGPLANFIEDAADPDSKDYLKVSASWELAFHEYNLIKIKGNSKNIDDGEIVSDPEEISKLEKFLESNGGTGKIDEYYIYRQPKNETLALGIGLTESPAAEVKGVFTKQKDEKKIKAVEEFTEFVNNSSGKEVIEYIIKCYGGKEGVIETNVKPFTSSNSTSVIITNSTETSSQKEKHNVKPISIAMKIKNLKDINDETMKEISASAITEFVKDELEKASKDYEQKEKEAKEKIDASTQLIKDTEKKLNEATEKLSKVQEDLNKLQEAEKQRKDQDIFDTRMASFDNIYELDDDDRKVIASLIKGLNDEAFKACQTQISVLLKAKNKEAIAKKKELESKTQTTASTKDDDDKAVSTAVDKSKKEPTLPNTQTTEVNLVDKYKEAFSIKNVLIK
ncbi:MAG: hypothetical protein AABY22_14610 [Nanoarchaeota archaeon]